MMSMLLYLDPGTGSQIVQIIAGAILAGGAAFGIVWNTIKMKLTKKNSIKKEIKKNENNERK